MDISTSTSSMEISSAQVTPHLPDELMVEILSWLPVKSLLRFRCVSKSLKSIISDQNLVKLHLQRSPKNANIILTLADHLEDDDFSRCVVTCSIRSLIENPSSTISSIFGHPSSTIASLFDDPSSSDIVKDNLFAWRYDDNYDVCGSCNGLVCLRECLVRSEFHENCFYFWNPATSLKSNKSPSLHVHTACPRFGYAGFAHFGFGYDESCDTYKVVAVCMDSELNMVFKVLNMGDSCWRNMIISCPVFRLLHQTYGQFVNGTLNWLTFRRSGSTYSWSMVTNVKELAIFSLDLRKETYKHLLLPDGFDQVPSEEPSLGILMDCLCLFHDCKRTHFVIWKMDEFGVDKSWTQFVNVSYLTLQIDPGSDCKPFCTYENGDGVLIIIMEDWQAILYNRRDNRAQRFKFPSEKCWDYANDYVQSLVIPC